MQDIAGLMNMAYVNLSLLAVTILQAMIQLPMADGSKFSEGENKLDKRVSSAFLKNPTVMVGLARIGIAVAEEKNNTAGGALAFGVLGLINMILSPLDRRAIGLRVVNSWSSLR